jgi:hypothetical protein
VTAFSPPWRLRILAVGLALTVACGSDPGAAAVVPTATPAAPAGAIVLDPTLVARSNAILTGSPVGATPQPPPATNTPVPITVQPAAATFTPLPVPEVVSPGTTPEAARAVAIPPYVLAAQTSTYTDRNVLVFGLVVSATQSDGLTSVVLSAQAVGDTVTRQLVNVEFVPPRTDIAARQCYSLYGVMTKTTRIVLNAGGGPDAAPLVRGYAVTPLRFLEGGLTCASP